MLIYEVITYGVGVWGSFDFSVVFLPFNCLKEKVPRFEKLLVCNLFGFVLLWFYFVFT